MKRRHAFEITFEFTVKCHVNVDFRRCVAAVRKWFSTVLAAIKSGITIFISRLFAIPNLRWTVDTLKKLAVIVVAILLFHRLIAAMNSILGLGLSRECMQSLSDILVVYVLQEARFIK